VIENRRLLAAATGADITCSAMVWQQHGSRVVRAQGNGFGAAGTRLERADGLWSDTPGQAMTVLSADCLPIALCRVDGPPALAVLHVGWRGLLAGIVESAAGALGAHRLAAAIGPGIGPCCYEVGDDVANRYRERFGDDVVTGGKLDLWLSTERALRSAGAESVSRTDLCTACNEDRFFSHRRDKGRTGRQGMVGYVVER